MPLSEDRLREIAFDATRSLYAPELIGEITASLGVAFNGDEAYYFEIYLDQDADREEAARLRMALRTAIRDRVLAAGDETYPFARILRRHAAVA